MQLTFFDILIALIIFTSFAFGLMTGFIGTILSFVTWCFSVYCSYRYSDAVSVILSSYIAHLAMAKFVASIIILFFSLILFNIISKLILSLTSQLSLFGMDAMLGGALGVLRGAIIGLFLYTIIVFGFNATVQDRGFLDDSKDGMPKWLIDSFSYDYLHKGLEAATYYFARNDDKSTASSDIEAEQKDSTKNKDESIGKMINKFHKELKNENERNFDLSLMDKLNQLDTLTEAEKQNILHKLMTEYIKNTNEGGIEKNSITKEDMEEAEKLIEQNKNNR